MKYDCYINVKIKMQKNNVKEGIMWKIGMWINLLLVDNFFQEQSYNRIKRMVLYVI